MSIAKKITVHISEELLAKAQQSTGQGVTETVRQGLKLIAAGDAYEKLRNLRGKVNFSVNIKKLREDRR